MADISDELRVIEAASKGNQIRSALISTITKIQSDLTAFKESFDIDANKLIDLLDSLGSTGSVSSTYYNDVLNAMKAVGGGAYMSNSVLTKFAAQNVDVVGISAFLGCENLRMVSLPSATRIGASAFANCTSLSNVSFPLASSIAINAFRNCTSLASISLPAYTSVNSMSPNDGVFYGCGLETVELLVPSIGQRCFENCSALSVASFPNLTYIGSSAFEGCAVLTSVSAPNVTTIDQGAFANCVAIESLAFPSVTYIGSSAFANCVKLSSLSVPNVTSIGSYAFQNAGSSNGLSNWSMAFPSVTSIGNYAFSGCTLYHAEFPKLSAVPQQNTFSGFGVKELFIPKATSVTAFAFSGMTNLRVLDLTSLAAIETGAFRDCSNLRKLGDTEDLPDAYCVFNYATDVFASAFYGTPLTSFLLDNVTTVWSEAFAGCNAQYIYLSKVSRIYSRALVGCSRLRTLYLSSTAVVSLPDFSNIYDVFHANFYSSGTIRVPANLVNQYKTTGPWSLMWAHASRFNSYFIRAI